MKNTYQILQENIIPALSSDVKESVDSFTKTLINIIPATSTAQILESLGNRFKDDNIEILNTFIQEEKNMLSFKDLKRE